MPTYSSWPVGALARLGGAEVPGTPVLCQARAIAKSCPSLARQFQSACVSSALTSRPSVAQLCIIMQNQSGSCLGRMFDQIVPLWEVVAWETDTSSTPWQLLAACQHHPPRWHGHQIVLRAPRSLPPALKNAFVGGWHLLTV